MNRTGKSVHRPFKRHRPQHRSTKRPIDRVNRVYRHFLLHNRRTVERLQETEKKKETHVSRVRMYSLRISPRISAPLMLCTIFGKHVVNLIMMAKEIFKYNIVIFIIMRRRRSSFSCCHRCWHRCCCYRLSLNVPAPNSHILITEKH